MNINEYKNQVDETVVESMISFMTEWDDCDYNTEDIESCKEILYTYLDSLYVLENPTDDEIMKQVEIVILALNDLNEKTDYALIETGEREAICELIQESAIACGLNNYEDDITEEWREW